ncbi:MAG: carboxypeptidase regulatory-like domain-containing protein, partial [Burkholderiales bacterium]|nr:carboxypeptidase regulatory-like domain-containing protein [Burkholderiales bacterium]
MIVKLHTDTPHQVFSYLYPLFSRPTWPCIWSCVWPRVSSASATLFRTSILGLLTLANTAQAQDIEPRPSVMGTLRDQRQLPVADADVFVRSSAGSSSVFAKTDQEGRYQVFDLPPGNVVVVARDPATQALAMAQTQLQRPEQQMRLDVQVARADARLEGTIIHGGKPVVDAHISLLSRQVFADVGVAQRTTTTDANGHFKLERVMPGAMRIIVEADGLVSQQDVDMQGGSTQQVQIALGNSVYLPNVLSGEDGTSA